MSRLSHRLSAVPWLGLLLVGGLSVAQTVDNSGRVFPYTGYLEHDGTPVEGQVQLTLDLFTQAAGGSACDSLSFASVDVSQGRFNVLLDGVSDNCFVGTSLYVDVAVGPVGGGTAPLTSGTGDRVLVGSVPAAAQGSAFSRFFAEVVDTVRLEADDVDVANSVAVGSGVQLASDGSATFTGTVDVGALTANSGVSHIQGVRYSGNWSAYGDGNGNRAEIANDTSSYQALMLAGNGSSGLGRQVQVYDDLYVSRNLNVNGSISPHFDSGWRNANAGNTHTIGHPLGTIPLQYTVLVATGSNGSGQIHLGGDQWLFSNEGESRGVMITNITASNFRVRVGKDYLIDTYGLGGTRETSTSGSYRILLWK